MQTPEEMALYERGTLDCAKCLYSFGDNVLLDGEPVTCPQCGHRTVPRVVYSIKGKSALLRKEASDRRKVILLLLCTVFVSFIGCCGFVGEHIEGGVAVIMCVVGICCAYLAYSIYYPEG